MLNIFALSKHILSTIPVVWAALDNWFTKFSRRKFASHIRMVTSKETTVLIYTALVTCKLAYFWTKLMAV